MADTYGDGWNGGTPHIMKMMFSSRNMHWEPELCRVLCERNERLDFVYTPDGGKRKIAMCFFLSDGTILYEDGPTPAEGTVYRTYIMP